MGEKSEKKFLPETNVYCEQKTMEKNRLEKVRKHVFYKHLNIVTKKGGGETRENFFPETRRFRKQTTMEKNPQQKVRKHVFL